MAEGDQRTEPTAQGPLPLDTATPTEKIRDTAKWLIGVFGAIGALILARVQFTDLQGLTGDQRFAALGSIALAFLGICLSTSGVANLLLPRHTTWRDLHAARPRDSGRRFLEANPEAIQGFTSLASLLSAWQQDLSAYKSAFHAWRVSPTPHHRDRLRATIERARPVEAAFKSAAQIASYQRMRRQYQSMVRWRLFPGIILTTAGVVCFSIATGEAPGGPELNGVGLSDINAEGASFEGASLRNADLSGSDLSHVNFRDADLSGANLSESNLTGANLLRARVDGADLSSAVWKGTTCPDGTISDEVGGSCLAHLSP